MATVERLQLRFLLLQWQGGIADEIYVHEQAEEWSDQVNERDYMKWRELVEDENYKLHLLKWQEWQKMTFEEKCIYEQADRRITKVEGKNDPFENKIYPVGDTTSIVLEIISNLEILNHQLITADDIPAMLDFLDTPAGKEQEGWTKWKIYMGSIDWNQRKLELKGNCYYCT